MSDRNLFYRVNVEGTRTLIKACRRASVGKLVLTSSASVIYNGQDLRNAREDTPFPTHYIDYYTETKMLQEQLVIEANCDSLYTAAIRPHGIFGPRDHTVSEIIRKARAGQMTTMIGTGENLVDFTYVKNVTLAHILAAEKLGPRSRVNGQVYHSTNLEPVLFWAFIGSVLARLDLSAPTKSVPYWLVLSIAWLMYALSVFVRAFGGKWYPFLTPFKVALAGTHHYYNSEKAVKELDYKPVVSVEEGLDLTFQALKKQDSGKTEPHS